MERSEQFDLLKMAEANLKGKQQIVDAIKELKADIEILRIENEGLRRKKPNSVPEGWTWYFADSNAVPPEVNAAKKPLVFYNTPRTASLEMALEHLLAHFEKRAKENSKKEISKTAGNHEARESESGFRSGYYFSGKADSYTKAAEKIRNILRGTKEKWIVEMQMLTDKTWTYSLNDGLKGTFPSKDEAQAAIDTNFKRYPEESLIKRRVRRVE